MATILIIDDSPTDHHIFGNMLKKHGHVVLDAHDAPEGIELCRKTQPDLVIMDVVMPGMNGFQATRALSNDPLTRHIPIVIISTKNMETDRAWGLRQGAKDYLVKPPSEREFMTRINAQLPAGKISAA